MKAEPKNVYHVKSSIEDFKVDYWSILGTQSVTGNTKSMMEEIVRQLSEIKGVHWYTDTYGNLYATKGKPRNDDKYPSFVCHTDTVHKLRETFYVQKSEGGYFHAYTEDDGEFQQVGIGGDDKCGIIICIEMLHQLKYVKCAFFLDEESGCKGSAEGDLTFFDDCRYAIQVDRKGYGDIITCGNGVDLCSAEFKEMMTQLGKQFAYSPTTGYNTDVVQLKKRGLGISSCNLSAGYHNPHTKQEYITQVELIAVKEFCLAIAKIKTVYPHKYEAPKYDYPSRGGASYGSGYNSNYSPPPQTGQRLCLLCDKPTTYLDGKMCQACVHSNLMLLVKGDEKNLVIEVPISEIQKNECKRCDLEMYTQFEINRGICGDCFDSLCLQCGMILVTNTEHKRKTCKQCYDAGLQNEYDKVIDACDSCGDFLETYQDKQAGLCARCIAWDNALSKDENSFVADGRCPMNTCGNAKLETEIERTNEICNQCLVQYMTI